MTSPYEMAWLLLAGVTLAAGLLFAGSYAFWRYRLRGSAAPASAACRFRPARLQLRGTLGDVLRATVHTEGAAGNVFVTYVEESWVVVSPWSGMFPQAVEILVYTARAPSAGKHTVTVRLLPVEGEANAGTLDLTVKLKPPRSLPVRPNL